VNNNFLKFCFRFNVSTRFLKTPFRKKQRYLLFESEKHDFYVKVLGRDTFSCFCLDYQIKRENSKCIKYEGNESCFSSFDNGPHIPR
jgi:hypothetical protein